MEDEYYWNIYKDGCWIDTLFFPDHYTKEDVMDEIQDLDPYGDALTISGPHEHD